MEVPESAVHVPTICPHDLRLYNEFDICRLRLILFEHQQDVAGMLLLCDNDIATLQSELAMAMPDEDVVHIAWLPLAYINAVRWLNMLRHHQRELCQEGFQWSYTKMMVTDVIVKLGNKEQELRNRAKYVGIYVDWYQKLYA